MTTFNTKTTNAKTYGKPGIAINKHGTFLINKGAVKELGLFDGQGVSVEEIGRGKNKAFYLRTDKENGFPLKMDNHGMMRFTNMTTAAAVVGHRPDKTYRFEVEPSGKILK